MDLCEHISHLSTKTTVTLDGTHLHYVTSCFAAQKRKRKTGISQHFNMTLANLYSQWELPELGQKTTRDREFFSRTSTGCSLGVYA